MTAAARIREADIERAIRAVRKSAGTDGCVTLDLQNQKIHITFGKEVRDDSGPNPWDRELEP